MTATGIPSETRAEENGAFGAPGSDAPAGWEQIRAESDIQFEPIQPKEIEPREPGWLEQMLESMFAWLRDLFSPLGGALGANWLVVQWLLLAMLVAFVAYFAWRMIGPILRERMAQAGELPPVEPEWQPDRVESLALLEDADQLAAEGRFDEAARLLLRRSVGQIAAARPDWVDPSSTARELAALPALSDAARGAFAIISQAVERSLFALRHLTQDDWERARAAYADFALADIQASPRRARS